MKFSKLLVLGAFGLISMSVNAADLIERDAPEEPDWIVNLDEIDKTPCEFKVDEVYVMYNVGADMFYYRGNAWDSQATGSTTNALPVRFVMPEGKSLDDKALYLRDYFDRDSPARWRTAFITTGDGHVNGVFGDGTAALFTDNNDGGAALLWVESIGDKLYKLSISEQNTAAQPEGLYFGIDPDSPGVDSGEAGTVINPKATVEVNQTWQFFILPQMTEYFNAYKIYEKAGELKTLIEKAEEKGIDVNAAADVYNNLDATLEEIEAAMAALQEALASGIDSGTAENPTDATSVINNPDFDNASAAGWSGSSPNMVGSGDHGPANVAEFYQGDNVNMYQELNGIPAGVYQMTMYGFYRSGNTDASYQNYLDNANYRAKLYATVDGEMLTADIVNPFEVQNKESFAGATEWGVNAAEASSNGFNIPNDPSCARVYFNQGWYKNTLFFYVSGDKATIGVREDGSHLDTDWFPFDEFRLTYYGNTEASFGKWVELSAPDFSNMNVTVSLREDFASDLQDLISSATDKASALAAVEQLKPLVDAMKANAALWAKYIAKLDEAEDMIGMPDYSEFVGDILPDYLMDAEDIVGDLELTSEELEAEIEKLDKMIADMKQAAAEDIKPGNHVTQHWFTNCDFANGNAGWTIGKGGCNFSWEIAEAYGADFDIYQEHTPAKKGVYQLDLKGFFRTARGNGALASYQNNEQTCDAAVYIGTADATNRTKVKCVFAEVIDPALIEGGGNFLADGTDWTDGNYYANDMQSAATAFKAGMYKNTAYGIVKGEGETIRIGVGGKLGGNDWICWDDFDLIYLGYEDPTANAYLIDLAIEELNGMDLTKPMGKSVKTEVDNAISAANNAKGSGDGAAMFDALSDLYDMKAKIEASQALFAELTQLVEDVMAALDDSENQEAINDAGTVAYEIQQGMDNFAYEDTDIPALKLRLQKVLTALYLPGNMAQASDANPIDVTKVIISADYGNEDLMEYDDNGELISLGNSTKGWEGDAGNIGNEDQDGVNQRTAYAYEFWDKTFEHYQTLYGMPAGIYEVEVTAYNRYGTNGEDVQAYRNGTQNTAYLFAETGDQLNTIALPFLAVCVGADAVGIAGEVTVMLDAEGNETSDESQAVETFYRPGSLVSAKEYFAPEYYGALFLNKVVAKVGDDGLLKIGIKKTENQSNGWCVMDDWKLTYYGTGSAKQPTGDLWSQGIEETVKSTLSKVEFFTLDGRKATAAQKGVMIVRQTMSDGKVIVRKVRM